MRRLLFLLAAALFGSSCQGPGLPQLPASSGGAQSRSPDSAALALPTKDDVALVDGRSFSIAAFTTVRTILQNKSTEAVFWAGTAALAVQNQSRITGRELTPPAALDVARYAMGELPQAAAEPALHAYLGPQAVLPAPAELHKELDRLVSRSVVQRNPQVLAEMH